MGYQATASHLVQVTSFPSHTNPAHACNSVAKSHRASNASMTHTNVIFASTVTMVKTSRTLTVPSTHSILLSLSETCWMCSNGLVKLRSRKAGITKISVHSVDSTTCIVATTINKPGIIYLVFPCAMRIFSLVISSDLAKCYHI